MILVMARATMAMASFMMARDVLVHAMVAGMLAEHLALHAGAANRAQHCRRHRAPDGEQDSQQ